MSKDLLVNVDDDGLIESDQMMVETYYHDCDSVYIDRENHFVGIIFDNGGVDGETRVALETLQKLGIIVEPAAQQPGGTS